jgi:RNA-directed DNA polymerase
MPALDFNFKRRTYLHFDLPVSKRVAEALVMDAAAVARHPFYPFLGYTMKIERISRDADGRAVKRVKQREIKIAAHRDAAIYSYYSQVLSEAYEVELAARGLGDNVRAFRSLPGGGNNIKFAKEVFDFIEANRPCVALGFDVEGFFDNLDHSRLKQAWSGLLQVDRLPVDHFHVFKSLTMFSWVDREEALASFGISANNPKAGGRTRLCSPDEFRFTVRQGGLLRHNPTPGKGIPQGSPISACLSNLYMLEFDAAVASAVSAVGGLYRRYCDDIMVVVPPGSEQSIRQLVTLQIAIRGLTINEAKTDRAAFPVGTRQSADKAIQYLGFLFNGAQTLLRPASLNRYYGKMRHGVALAKQTQRKHNQRELAENRSLTPLRRTKLYRQYSYLIWRRAPRKNGNPKSHGNFLSYAHDAARQFHATEIKRQVRNHWNKLQKAINQPMVGQLRGP